MLVGVEALEHFLLVCRVIDRDLFNSVIRGNQEVPLQSLSQLQGCIVTCSKGTHPAAYVVALGTRRCVS